MLEITSHDCCYNYKSKQLKARLIGNSRRLTLYGDNKRNSTRSPYCIPILYVLYIYSVMITMITISCSTDVYLMVNMF